MAALVWVMVGLALWHFTVFLPDRFWGGIVGAFLGTTIGAVVVGVIINGGSVPGKSDTDLVTGLQAIPGVIVGLAIMWWLGARQERAAEEAGRL